MKKSKWFIKHKIHKDEFIRICKECDSMSQAAAKMKIHFNSFKRMAIKLDCYKTNQGGKGYKKISSTKISTEDIIYKNLQPQYQTYKLKQRLLKEGIVVNKCSVCDIEKWNEKELNMELDHIDGNRTNHNIKNLRMICPNCHAQTSTYRAKNK